MVYTYFHKCFCLWLYVYSFWHVPCNVRVSANTEMIHKNVSNLLLRPLLWRYFVCDCTLDRCVRLGGNRRTTNAVREWWWTDHLLCVGGLKTM